LSNPGNTKKVAIGVALALVLWTFTFLTGHLGSFWHRVTISAIALAAYTTFADRQALEKELRDPEPSKLFLGVGAGILLYAIFFLGYSALRILVEEGATDVYLLNRESPVWLIASLLVVTSFCEEYFWRAFVQRRLMESHGSLPGLLVSTLAYALIHAPTMNAPLVAAAFIAGLFWALLYLRTRSLWLVASSHMIWTELVFVFLPLG